MRSSPRVWVLLSAVLGLSSPAVGQPEQVPNLLETTVGMRRHIEELRLPGTRLRPVPVADPQAADVILRVLDVFPHGTELRYNLEVTALVPGRLDLRDHLEREDGSSIEDLPELPILVHKALPLGQVEPNPVDVQDPDRVGGYRAWQIAAGALWLVGLVAILFVGRRRRGVLTDGKSQRPLSLADRLRPLVEGAQAGSLDIAGRAQLERLLLAHWRRRRNLEDAKAGEAIATLRRDPEAGALLLKLEEWLHRPNAASDVDIPALLEPYRNAPDLPARKTV